MSHEAEIKVTVNDKKYRARVWFDYKGGEISIVRLEMWGGFMFETAAWLIADRSDEIINELRGLGYEQVKSPLKAVQT